MKTLLITTDNLSNTGGVSHYYQHLKKFWPGGKLEVLDNSSNQLLSHRFWPKWRKSFSAISQNLKTQKPEWLLVGQILPLGIVVFFLSFFYSFKYCLIFHGMDLSLAFSGRKKFFSRLIIGRANKIVCANSYTAEKLKSFNPLWAKKITVINPGVSPEDEFFC